MVRRHTGNSVQKTVARILPFKVTLVFESDTVQWDTYDFVLVIHSKYMGHVALFFSQLISNICQLLIHTLYLTSQVISGGIL